MLCNEPAPVHSIQMESRAPGQRPDRDGTQVATAAVRSCKGLRMPAMTTTPHAPTAGVGKASMQEVAEGEAPFGAVGSMAI